MVRHGTARKGTSMRLRTIAWVSLLVVGVGCGDSKEAAPKSKGAAESRPKTWATRIQKPGLPNFHKIDDGLYRGAQPTAEGMKQLKEMGVRTVINLRSFHSDRDEIGDTGLAYEHIYMKAWHPEDKEVVRFLQIVTDKARRPVFFHCQHGADRTGTMCAIYRIAIQGWSKEDAVKEMVEGGYGFHGIWQNLKKYIDELDIDEMKRRAGLDGGKK
jgi:protein tyrosine phosphatase (PTP) superfamily phosphohydrolase (DUF442 family)